MMKESFRRIYGDSYESYCKLVSSWLLNEERKMIVTANPETMMLAESDEDVIRMFKDEEISFVPDGIGVVKACRMLDIPVTERIAGVDIAEYLLEEGSRLGKTIYLFGSKQEVLEAMKEVIEKKYSELKVVGMTNGYVEDKDQVFESIAKIKPDICLVALGIPLQEKLISRHLDKFEKGIFVGVGGSLDVLSGSKKRAPKIFIKCNLEWLYRIMREPKRIKRFYNNNVKFIMRVRKLKK